MVSADDDGTVGVVSLVGGFIEELHLATLLFRGLR